MWSSILKKDDKIDKCVLCGKPTDYSKDTPVYNRDYYVDGAGQLCPDCYKDLYLKEKSREGEREP